MKVRHKGSGLGDKVDLNMTPMIDVVFQLLAFFIMTLKFTIPEGDFNIKMPATAPSSNPNTDPLIPPIVVKMTAGANGSLRSMTVNGAAVADFTALRNKIISTVGPGDRGPGAGSEAEVELDCEYGLRYENVISAVTHVSGYLDDAGNTVKLVEKIKFKPPVKPN